MTNSSRPLTPPDCDVRDYPRMMVDVRKLLDSEFNRKASAVPLAWMVGHKLWYRAFHQFPAGSLPADDGELCALSELGLDIKSFKRVRPLALHGWAVASDGRLYHAMVARVVLEVWIDKLLLKLKSGAGNARRHASKGFTFDAAPVVLSLETAGAYLALLDPEARGLEKIRRRSERDPSDFRKASDCAPTGSSLGGHSESESAPSDVRVSSQAKAKAEAEEIDRGGTGAREPIDQARRAQVASLQALLMEAGGEALKDIAASPALANLSPILNLLEPGTGTGSGPPCDLEADVLPVVRQRCARARPRSIASWNFFVDRIVEARDRRLQGPPPISEIAHEHGRSHVYPQGADPDSRRSNTERRRDAWAELAEERDGASIGGQRDGGGSEPPSPGDPGRPRLAYARSHS